MCQLSVLVLVCFIVISALISNDCVSAVRTYDRCSSLDIRESMERLFDSWESTGSCLRPGALVIRIRIRNTLYLFNPKKRLRRRGCRAGAQVKMQWLSWMGVLWPQCGERIRWLWPVSLQDAGGNAPQLKLPWMSLPVGGLPLLSQRHADGNADLPLPMVTVPSDQQLTAHRN